MPYIGRSINTGEFKIITLSESFDGSRVDFTMSESVGNVNQLIVILSGIVQHWSDAFTISNNILTFSSAPASGETIKILKLGDTNDIGVPSDASVTADKLASTLNLSSKTLTLPASSVTAHVSQFDDSAIRSDISALALREATNEASAAFNLPNSFIDTFATDVLGTKTNISVDSDGYLASTTITNEFTATKVGDVTYDTSTKQFGSGSVSYGGVYDTTGDYITYNTANTGVVLGSSDFTLECWIKVNSGASGRTRLGLAARRQKATATGWFWNLYNGKVGFGYNDSSVGWLDNSGSGTDLVGTSNLRDNAWHHIAVVRASNVFSFYVDGTRESTTSSYSGSIVEASSSYNLALGDNASDAEGTDSGGNTSTTFWGNIDEMRISNTARYSGASYTVPTAEFVTDNNTEFLCHFNENTFSDSNTKSTNATGTGIQNTNTVGSAKTEVSGTMIYKDLHGTATLGTDIKIYFSCNGGSNWTEAASYNAITPVYATGIKQVRLGKTTCTSGTDIRYKAVWANQASGSKETQLHGISINY